MKVDIEKKAVTLTETMPKEVLTQKENEKEPKMDNEAKRGDATKPLRRKRVPITAEWGIKIRRLNRKDGLFKVQSLESKAVHCIVDLNAKTCTCPDFTQQGTKCKHVEVVENIGEIRRQKRITQIKNNYWINRDGRLAYSSEYYQKNRERICAKFNERYKYDPEFREECLKTSKTWREKNRDRMKAWWEKRREEYERFKIEYGGKCTVCGEDDLDVLVPHHPHGKKQKNTPFIKSKEFTDWIKYGRKPDVVLMCANHHLKLLAER